MSAIVLFIMIVILSFGGGLAATAFLYRMIYYNTIAPFVKEDPSTPPFIIPISLIGAFTGLGGAMIFFLNVSLRNTLFYGAVLIAIIGITYIYYKLPAKIRSIIHIALALTFAIWYLTHK